MKKVFLFDMDGTLTPPRQKMPIDIEIMLKAIQDAGHEIGIITGSDMNYVKQQCSGLFDLNLMNTSEIHFFPCNGTKYILDNKKMYSKNMREYMGDNAWHRLITFLIEKQCDIVSKLGVTMPLTGHFFDYRESTLNWCPIGRNANDKDRAVWEFIDKDNFIRTPLLNEIQDYIDNNIRYIGDLAVSDVEIQVKYGGDTSFDIFPKGWDKTFPLNKKNMFEDYKIYFVGDRCKENGNDYELFMHPKTKGFETHSTQQTIEIVNKILNSNV